MTDKNILCGFERELDLFYYQELSDSDYEELSDKFLALSKFFRKNKSKMGLKRPQKIFFQKKLKEMANCLLINTRNHPDMKEFRIQLAKRSFSK